MFMKVVRVIGLASLLTGFMSSFAFGASTEGGWNHHIKAWEARSIEQIVSDYSDESVLVLNNRIFKGREEIAHVFSQLFRIFDNGVNRIDTPVVLDRFVYITWHFTPTGGGEHYGTDTFVIENGKIVLQTIASSVYELLPVLP